MVTLADIAKRAGVSVVSVSKALSGQKGVGEQMRQRIIEIANERGYQKSVSIEANESYKIGVLIGSRYVGNIDSFYGHMYQIFSAKAAKIGSFTMLEILSDADEKNLVYPKIIGDGNVDAVVIMGALGEEYLNMLDEKLGTPTFYMDFTDRKHKKDSVISGSFYGSYILTNYLFDKGHTQIGYVGTVLSTPSITDRYLGYVRAMMEHGIDIKKEWILNDRSINNDKVDIENNLVLPKGKLPTAFVCNCDLTAGVLIKRLEKEGYKVPDDFSVVGYDNFIFPGVCDVEITTYEVDMPVMVQKAVSYLTSLLKGENVKMGTHIITGHLIEKDSVKALS